MYTYIIYRLLLFFFKHILVYRVLPKTDNTYSPGSKYYKYEVSPGIPFIPNMSRLPLKSYEKTPLKQDFSEDQSSHIFNSSHISLFIHYLVFICSYKMLGK
jgi:hypothetical protein